MMKKIGVFLTVLCGFMLLGNKTFAQVAVKTNLATWATTTPNLALEFGMSKRTTLEVGGTYNPFTFDNGKKFKHWMVQPEFRLWNCEKFNRGFWGIHAMGGQFNAGNLKTPFNMFPKLKKFRYEGWFVGGGISYGYQWYISPHWNLEATIGAGYIYVDMDKYECGKCGTKLGHETYNYWGITKLGVSFVYLF